MSAVVTFLAGNVAFYFIIGDHGFSKHISSVVVSLRVILLDGLFLVMGIVLGVFIIIVSGYQLELISTRIFVISISLTWH